MNSKELENFFINIIMKAGKKSVASKIFAKSMVKVHLMTGLDPNIVFFSCVKLLRPFFRVDIRRVGWRRKHYKFSLLSVEQNYKKALHILYFGVVNRSNNKVVKNFSERFANELVDIYFGKETRAVRRRNSIRLLTYMYVKYMRVKNFSGYYDFNNLKVRTLNSLKLRGFLYKSRRLAQFKNEIFEKYRRNRNKGFVNYRFKKFIFKNRRYKRF